MIKLIQIRERTPDKAKAPTMHTSKRSTAMKRIAIVHLYKRLNRRTTSIRNRK